MISRESRLETCVMEHMRRHEVYRRALKRASAQWYCVACVELGDRDEAFAAFERALAEEAEPVPSQDVARAIFERSFPETAAPDVAPGEN